MRGLALVLFSVFVGLAFSARAQEVNGIYTEAATKDLGELSGNDSLKGIKFRGWLEGYYVWNQNDVRASVANANQGFSAIKARDLTIEGRAFDVHANRPTINLIELEVEKVPNRGRFGFKVDLAGGDTQKIIFDTIKAVSPDSLSNAEENIQHASLSYLAPIGTGLRVDVGKFVTHIGGETIESIKNRNFSHAFFYTYAIPFQDTGVRLNYAFNSKVYGELYILKGWNVTKDNNDGKTVGLSLGWTPSPKFSLYANYMGGPEQNNNDDNLRHLIDLQAIFLSSPTLQTMVNVDVATDENALGSGEDARWGGVALTLRKTIGDHFFPTVRAEYYNDQDGFTTGVGQRLWGTTFTADYRIGGAKSFTKVLIRPEIRYDRSSETFFSRKSDFRSERDQLTAGVGLVLYF